MDILFVMTSETHTLARLHAENGAGGIRLSRCRGSGDVTAHGSGHAPPPFLPLVHFK